MLQWQARIFVAVYNCAYLLHTTQVNIELGLCEMIWWVVNNDGQTKSKLAISLDTYAIVHQHRAIEFIDRFNASKVEVRFSTEFRKFLFPTNIHKKKKKSNECVRH